MKTKIKEQNLNVIDLFKQFCKERHAEDKGKNYDLLQEIYAKTELFDLSFVPYDKSYLSEIVDNSINTTTNKDSFTAVAIHSVFKDVTIPFESLFVKVWAAGVDIESIFIREYKPFILTGTLYSVTPNKFVINTPFTLKTDTGELSFSLKGSSDYFNFMMKGKDKTEEDKKKYLKYAGACLLGLLIFTLKTLCNLPKHSVVSDTPKHAEYYTRKHGSTIKVIKPIYYVLDKKEETEKRNYNRIKPLGHLAFDHSFKVIGHWRKISPHTYGKNRNGEYVVTGMTWVKEHVRGEGDLIRKIRVVK